MTGTTIHDRDTRINGDTPLHCGTGRRPPQKGDITDLLSNQDVSRATRDTDPHIEALSRTKTKTAAIRYAVAVLAGAPPAEVMAWLAHYGYTVSRSKVSPEVNAYRDAHGLTADTATTAPGRPDTGGQSPSTSADAQIAAGSPSPHDAGSADGTRPAPNNGPGSSVPTRVPQPTGHPISRAGDIPAGIQRTPSVASACYGVAVMSLLVSLTTSWRFFDTVLHIPTTNGERLVMFAVAELALVVCGAGMAVNIHHQGQPGSFRLIVWTMCAAMAYMAWAMSPLEEAIGRILLGPVLGTVMLHLGLGLELRAHHQQPGALARISHELRERCLSRLGLADDGRDAAQRTRDRNAYQAAALSRPRRPPWSRQAKLERALLAAGVADDPAMRDRMLARLAVVRHASDLATISQPSPWAQP